MRADLKLLRHDKPLAATAAGVPAAIIGTAQGQGLTLPGIDPISLTEARAANDRFFPAWMN